ncbi:unnamed protein product [Bursaphelenchus okinawaensis]|uniref:RRM domain-containing protein n=1 Tax=Bursaphelenchus okinawaensis TaxID=465554 RepID=A0A811KT65_9BILA|nr:unnamed protein product [Bursaphelenchus okinawaensis]CAG9109620.1 unnamed protein product [Bursaphelenchus okinawaensis]
MGRDRGSGCLYVGNLPPDCRSRDLEDVFHKYGRIKFCDVKNRNHRGGVSFGFVEFDDPRDAEDALRGRDGYDFDGHRLRVEETRGNGPRGPGGRPLNGPDDRRRERGRFGGGGGPRRRGHRIYVSGLPPTGSWQDLKDHMRSVGEIVCADVNRDGTGIIEFARYDDAKYAVKKMDDSKFTSHEGETSYIRVSEDSPRRSRTRSRTPRSRSRSPRRSERRSPVYSDRSASRSRSRSRS